MSTVGRYEMVFPVKKTHLPFVELALEAGEALYDQVADLGYRPTSAIRYELVARVDVELADDGPDEPLPWEGREGFAAEMFDRRAA